MPFTVADVWLAILDSLASLVLVSICDWAGSIGIIFASFSSIGTIVTLADHNVNHPLVTVLGKTVVLPLIA